MSVIVRLTRWLGASLLVLLCACTRSSTGDRPSHGWTVPGSMRVGLRISPHSLNPIFAQTLPEFMLVRLFSDVLTTFDPTGTQLLPILAAVVPTRENGGISADGLVVTFRLRHGVRWHDGMPFTSKDVKFTFEAIMDASNDVASREGYDDVAGVTTPDRYTVRFKLKHRYAPIVADLFGDGNTPYGIIPAHRFRGPRNLNRDAFNGAPIGTGPFKVVRWARGDRVELEANANYFLGAPKLRNIIVSTVPDDSALVTRLLAHEIDWLAEATPVMYGQLRRHPDIKTVLTRQNHYYCLRFNLSHAGPRDLKLRQAVVSAIDRDRLVRDFTFGAARAADMDIPDFSWGYPRGLVTLGYDPGRARRLTRESSYLQQKLPLQLVFNAGDPQDRSVSVAIQQMLAEVGIHAALKGYSAQLFSASYGAGGILYAGKFDMVLSRWIAGPDPDNSGEFLCRAMPPGGYNIAHYCNPEIDALENAALAHYDRPTRRALYRRIETILARDVPHAYLWWPRLAHGLNPDVKHFAPNPLIESWNAYQWSI